MNVRRWLLSLLLSELLVTGVRAGNSHRLAVPPAANSPTCPVQFLKARLRFVTSRSTSGQEHPVSSLVQLQMKNVSEDAIEEMRFHLTAVLPEGGVMGEQRLPVERDEKAVANLAPQEKKRVTLEIEDSGYLQVRSVKLWLEEMTFASGRRWKNPNANDCLLAAGVP